jgi:hypothetical protein
MSGNNYLGSVGQGADTASDNTEAVAIVGVPSTTFGQVIYFVITSSRGSGSANENGINTYFIDNTDPATDTTLSTTVSGNPTGSLFDDAVNTSLGDIVDIATATVGSTGYFFALSDTGQSIQAMSIDQTGAVSNHGFVDLATVTGSGTIDPQSLDIVADGTSLFLITSSNDRLHAVEFDTTTDTLQTTTAAQLTTGGGSAGDYWASTTNSFVEVVDISGTQYVLAGGDNGNSGLDLFTFDSTNGFVFQSSADAAGAPPGSSGLANVAAADITTLGGRTFIVAGGDSSGTAAPKTDSLVILEITGSGPAALSVEFELPMRFDRITDVEFVESNKTPATPADAAPTVDILVANADETGLVTFSLSINSAGDPVISEGISAIPSTDLGGNAPDVSSIAALDTFIAVGSPTGGTGGGATSVLSTGVSLPEAVAYSFVGESSPGNYGLGTDADGGDFDGDGYNDLLIGAAGRGDLDDPGSVGGGSGSVYLISSADFDYFDNLDGVRGGAIQVGRIEDSGTNSYEFTLTGFADTDAAVGSSVRFIDDIDGDGRDDFLIGAPGAEIGGTAGQSGIVFTISSSLLAAIDAADGDTDNVIDLNQAAVFSGAATTRNYKYISETGSDTGGYGITGSGTLSSDAYLGFNIVDMASHDSDDFNELLIVASNVGYEDVANPVIGNGVDQGGTVYYINSDQQAALDHVNLANRDGIIDVHDIAVQNAGASWAITSGVDLSLPGTQPDGVLLGEYGVDWSPDQFGDGYNEVLIGAAYDNTAPGGGAGGTDPVGSGNQRGVAYLLASDDFQDFNDEDNNTSDRVIFVENFDAAFAANSGTFSSYRFYGDGTPADRAGRAVAVLDDFFGDGGFDYAISAYQDDTSGSNNRGTVYVINGDELGALDILDGGPADHSINLGDIEYNYFLTAGTSTSFTINHQLNSRGLGLDLDTTGDIDGDGIDELLISYTRGAVLVASGDRIGGDGQGGFDGNMTISDLQDAANSNSYQFSAGAGDVVSFNIAGVGDVDGDGLEDFFLGAPDNPNTGGAGAGFLVRASQLAGFDANDGNIDNEIGLDDFVDFLPVCFVRGTLVETADGPVAVENLTPGDLVFTMDNGLQPISWIGSSHRRGHGDIAPICIKKGALGNTTDLYVSPQHRMLVQGPLAELYFGEDQVLATAKSLVSGDMIYRAPCEEVEYFHVMFDRHQIIYANGAPSESFKPGAQGMASLSDETQQEIYDLFPELLDDLSGYGAPARTELKHHEGQLMARLGL